MSEWQPNGPHLYRIDDDTLFVQIHGATDVADLSTIFAVSAAIVERCGYVISVTDARQGVTLTPAARKEHAKWAREHRGRLTANIVFGAARAPSIIINLVAHALRTSFGFDMGLLFARDEAEALLLVARERVRLAKAAAARLSKSRG